MYFWTMTLTFNQFDNGVDIEGFSTKDYTAFSYE